MSNMFVVGEGGDLLTHSGENIGAKFKCKETTIRTGLRIAQGVGGGNLLVRCLTVFYHTKS